LHHRGLPWRHDDGNVQFAVPKSRRNVLVRQVVGIDAGQVDPDSRHQFQPELARAAALRADGQPFSLEESLGVARRSTTEQHPDRLIKDCAQRKQIRRIRRRGQSGLHEGHTYA
jgi:hypothetical protein